MAKQEYIEKNRQLLAEKTRRLLVQPLDKGVCCRVIKSGDPKGAQPNRNSVVTGHYTGKTINRKRSVPGIHGGSTLIFDIELMAVN